MALILSFETSTTVCSVALSRNGVIVDSQESFETKSHASLLTVFAQDILQRNSISAQELDAVAVSQGPGSYTGLRIGVSAAKGLCYSLGKKLLAVDTLKAMALMAADKVEAKPDVFCAMIDARRMEVYCAMFDQQLNRISNTEAVVVDENSFAATLSGKKVAFFGDGAAKCMPVINSQNAVLVDGVYPSARYMAVLAEQSFAAGDFKDVAYFEPFYLKDFVATKPKNKVL
ncbi:MAG: tRNA (adenosine(37)-N6)-threonylcarbamoyltransferase complex dimerization subunit type 1 TsaB [Salinivirgaceae bacterium]|nr:tRNA (adenosine(37)-N6)-threonylcarbamoyltransferase complex dimerization subunit type 1 TsaB [Salinivirgaceae bacterium]